MNTNTRSSLSEALAGTAPFLLWGLMLIALEIPRTWMEDSPVLGIALLGGLIFALPVGMCIGWIKSFPRWSYPYVGNTLIFNFYLMNASTPGFLFGRELWGWRAWIPFLVIAGIAFTVTRSLKPVVRFYQNIVEDWTVLTFTLFGFMPLTVAILFDEMDRLYSLYFMVPLTILMCGTAFLYLYGKERRVLVLVTGISLIVVIAVLGPAFFWHEKEWVWQIKTITAGLLFMFSPCLIRILPRYLSHKAA
jgi:hypothetical protein